VDKTGVPGNPEPRGEKQMTPAESVALRPIWMSQWTWVKFTKISLPHYMQIALDRFLFQLRKLECPAPVLLHRTQIHSTQAIKCPSPRHLGMTTK